MVSVSTLVSQAIKPKIIISFLFIVVLSYFRLDQDLAQGFMTLDLAHYWPYLSWLNVLGESVPYLILFFVLACYFQAFKKNQQYAECFWFLWFSVLIPITVCTFLKIMLGRARPILWLQEQVYGFYGFKLEHDFWSFPSGHTTVLMGLAFGLCVLLPKKSFVWIGIGLLLSSIRIILLHHYLSDVLVAGYLALLEIGFLLYVLKKKDWLHKAYA